MMKKIPILFFILLLLLLSACQTTSSQPSDEAPLEVVNLLITPTLEHWLPRVADCANDIPAFGIYTQVSPLAEPGPDQPDLVIRLGARTENDTHVVVLGMETFTVVAGSEVPLSSLSIESLQNIFSAEWTNWRQVPEIMTDGDSINQPIQTLSYPDGHMIRDLFSTIFLEENNINSQPVLFSTVDRLAEILAGDPYAIGYLLESDVPENAKVLEITGIDPQATRQLVLAVTPQEPQGKLRQLLLCLQNSP